MAHEYSLKTNISFKKTVCPRTDSRSETSVLTRLINTKLKKIVIHKPEKLPISNLYRMD